MGACAIPHMYPGCYNSLDEVAAFEFRQNLVLGLHGYENGSRPGLMIFSDILSELSATSFSPSSVTSLACQSSIALVHETVLVQLN